MAMEEETPVFWKQKVNFVPPERITHMCVSSELIVLAMANGILFRIDLKQKDKHEGKVQEICSCIDFGLEDKESCQLRDSKISK